MSKCVPILYGYWRSSCTWRVRIALNWKGIEFKNEVVNLLTGEHLSPKLIDRSPFAMVPVLVVGEEASIMDSLAIIEYLEEKYPNARKLLPGDAENRAKIRAMALQIIANLQPLQNLKVLKYYADEPSKRSEWAGHWIVDMFTKLESALQKTAGKYAIGDEVTLVDVCIPSQVYNAKRFGVDLTPFPTIVRLEKTLSALPEFAAADARCQPDTPESERVV